MTPAAADLAYHAVLVPLRRDPEAASFATAEERTRHLVEVATSRRLGDGVQVFLFDGARVPYAYSPARRLLIGGQEVVVPAAPLAEPYLTPPPAALR